MIKRNTISKIRIDEIDDPLIRFRLLIEKLYKTKGFSGTEIAELMDLSKSQVYYWIDRYTKEGVKGLQNRPRLGRTPVLDYETISRDLLNEPLSAGYNQLEWDVDLIKKYLLDRYQKSYSTSYIYQILHKIGISLFCKCLNCPRSNTRLLPKGPLTPMHLEVMADAAMMLDAPIHRIISEKGLKPILKLISHTNNRTILSGKTEHGRLTLMYDENVEEEIE